MLAWIRRLLAILVTILAIIVAIPLAGLGYGYLTTEPVTVAPPAPASDSAARISARLGSEIAGYKRPEVSTFLTYPEWAIVYAAREYAGLVADASPRAFPYWAYIGRFWRDYALMVRATADYGFNVQNHLMLMVIGISHTVEHAVQWSYENTVGWLTELTAMFQPVPEDTYQTAVSAEYAAFLDQVPWYRFPYGEKRAGLWDTGPASGFAAIRSWERKLGFGLAYSIKQGYADLIKSGLDATSEAAHLDIHVWAQGAVAAAIAGEPDTELVEEIGADGAVFVTRRYQVFTDMIPRLIERGMRFVEIGGNRIIFLTLTADEEIAAPEGTQAVFDYALPADRSMRRIGLIVPVGELHTALPELTRAGAVLEHVYDY
ncbi:MAG: hypothetical protein JJ864_09080 [Rhizobiaceae bacterium]|nr:hypothetical protein [Rhizobiaceae bacterium]